MDDDCAARLLRPVAISNPLEDISNVRRLQLALKEGRVVSDKRHLNGAVP